MDVKIKGKNLVITHKLKKGEMWKVAEGKKFKTLSIYQEPTKVGGLTSYCSDGKQVIFADFDNCYKFIVLEDFKRIQKEYNLPPAYLFTTKEEKDDNGELYGNYHFICLSKMYSSKIYEILSKTHCDINYVSMILRNRYKSFVLRISNKDKRDRPKFVEIIGDKNNLNCEISRSHLNFLNRIYNIPKIDYSKLDSLNKIYLQKYDTLNT